MNEFESWIMIPSDLFIRQCMDRYHAIIYGGAAPYMRQYSLIHTGYRSTARALLMTGSCEVLCPYHTKQNDLIQYLRSRCIGKDVAWKYNRRVNIDLRFRPLHRSARELVAQFMPPEKIMARAYMENAYIIGVALLSTQARAASSVSFPRPAEIND